MDELGVGVVGCGFVGRGAHVPAIRKIEGARLAAVADRDTSRLAKIGEKYQPQSLYEDYATLVADPAVEAVIVSRATPLHAEISLAAIRAGKHVLCEMPLAANLDEAETIIREANERGVLLMPGLTFRFTPNFVLAKQKIQQADFGQPIAFSYRELIPASDLANQWPVGSWVWDLAKSGGPLYTLSVWSIDLVRWLFDAEITNVSAAANYTRLETLGGTLGYDAAVNVQLDSGVVGCLQYSGSVTAAASACTLEIVGDSTQVLRTQNNDKLTLLANEPPETSWHVGEPGARMWGHMQQDEHFVRCIRKQEEPAMTPHDGRIAMELAQKSRTPIKAKE